MRVHRANFHARSPEEIVPDGVIDWHEGLFGPRLSKEEQDARCPVEFLPRRCWLGGLVSPDEARRRIAAGERCPPQAQWEARR